MKDVEGVDDRITILWFTEGDSLDAWDEFAGAGERVAATGLGRVELMAPFTPTLPGTDRYVDELRAWIDGAPGVMPRPGDERDKLRIRARLVSRAPNPRTTR